MSLTKRTLTFLCVLILVLQIAGAWSIYTSALYLHRQSKCLRLADKSKWTEFSLPVDDFLSSLQDESEFEVDGKMYDIVDYVISDDHAHVTAVKDEVEDTMHSTLQDLRRGSSDWTALVKYAYSLSLSNYIMHKLVEFSMIIPVNTYHHTFFYSAHNSVKHCIPIDLPPLY